MNLPDNQINKPYILISKDVDVPITGVEKEMIEKSINENYKFIKVEDKMIMLAFISSIIPISDYKAKNIGGNYCPKHKDNFVPKNKTCGYCG